ncbi:MAG: MraY family glycosyltransferase [Candidatus Daviesbacteria bacterium]|nr:MraY family glycosyltransferase [Candidatus Daviesbacteria bacterium]
MDILLIFTTAFALTALFVPVTIILSKKLGLLDDPKKRPHPAHIQQRIVPRGGGLPIFISIIVSMLLFIPITPQLIGIILGLTILLIIGLLDDRYSNFNPYLRLSLLFLAAAFPVISAISIPFITNPFTLLPNLVVNTTYISLGGLALPLNLFGFTHLLTIGDVLAFFWIVTLTQIINWSKGVDGQMPIITLITALTLGFLSLRLFLQDDPNQLNVAKLSFIVAGSSLGFLIFNWHPAKIFPGFAGSTILAFMLAVLAILSGAKLATALLVLAVPSADFIYTFIRRIVTGHSPVWGDRGHLHHKLLDLGWSHQKISLFYAGFSAIFGLVALGLDVQSKAFIVLAVMVASLGLILWLNSFGDLSKR